MRMLRSTYGWSLEPISRHFNEVLRGVLPLSHEFIKLPDPSAIQPDDYKWKWFEDCLGALDGTHIDMLVPLRDQGRYRNRKQKITTNVLGVCDRYMRFVYVLAGWEGSASDSRVLCDTMTREDAFAVPNREDAFALRDDAPKGPTAKEVLAALDEIPGLDDDTSLDLYDILTSDARNFESMMALPFERRKKWLLKQYQSKE
ncbi:hypothetical protein ACP4OV_003293 [Aristida adscensionis]